MYTQLYTRAYTHRHTQTRSLLLSEPGNQPRTVGCGPRLEKVPLGKAVFSERVCGEIVKWGHPCSLTEAQAEAKKQEGRGARYPEPPGLSQTLSSLDPSSWSAESHLLLPRTVGKSNPSQTRRAARSSPDQTNSAMILAATIQTVSKEWKVRMSASMAKKLPPPKSILTP